MPYSWTPESERALLLFAVSSGDFKPSTALWEMAAEKLGGEASANGCSQKFYKLKRESEALLGAFGDGTNAPSTPAVKKTRAPKSTGTGKSKAKRSKADMAAEDNDDAEADDTPVKKAKVKKEQAKEVNVKTDSENDGDEAIVIDDGAEDQD